MFFLIDSTSKRDDRKKLGGLQPAMAKSTNYRGGCCTESKAGKFTNYPQNTQTKTITTKIRSLFCFSDGCCINFQLEPDRKLSNERSADLQRKSSAGNYSNYSEKQNQCATFP